MIKGILKGKYGINYGNIGDFAFKYKGVDYYVGDVVSIYTPYDGERKNKFIAYMDGVSFVMGCKGVTDSGNTKGCDKFKVSKVKSFQYLKNGEVVDNITACIEEEYKKECGNKLERIMEILKEDDNVLTNLFDRVAKLSDVDSKSLIETGLKCSEEVGEMAQAILSYSNTCGCGYKKLDANDVAEEAVDIIIVALSVIYRAKGKLDVDDFVASMEYKMNKWEEKTGGK